MKLTRSKDRESKVRSFILWVAQPKSGRELWDIIPPLFFINFTIKLNGCKCVKKDDKRICGLVCASILIQKMKEQSSMEPDPYIAGSSIFGLEVYCPSCGPALHQSTSLCHKKCANSIPKLGRIHVIFVLRPCNPWSVYHAHWCVHTTAQITRKVHPNACPRPHGLDMNSWSYKILVLDILKCFE